MKKIIFTLAAVGMLSACSLDETPYGFYSSDNFYKTEGVSSSEQAESMPTAASVNMIFFMACQN